MPNVSFGARGLPLLLRAPGTGGRRRGTGDDMARLFCLSPGKNNSFGSARVATASTDRESWMEERERERWGKEGKSTEYTVSDKAP